IIAKVLPYRARFRAALVLAMLARPLAPLFGALGLKSVAAMLELAPRRIPAPESVSAVYQPEGAPVGRVALLTGCANDVLAPSITRATINVLTRHGLEVVIPRGTACCGSLVHHMGREHEALDFARNDIDVWTKEIEGGGLDAILVTIS